eukprot:gene36497-47531_t
MPDSAVSSTSCVEEVKNLLVTLQQNYHLKEEICKKIYDISRVDDQREVLASPDLGLLSALVTIIRTDKGQSRTHCCGAVRNIACTDEIEELMASPSLGLITALVSVIQEEKGQARTHACGSLWKISNAPINEVTLASEPTLLLFLVAVLTDDPCSPAALNACGTIVNISRAIENQIVMTDPELGLLSALVQVIKTDKGQTRVKACETIMRLSNATDNMIPNSIYQMATPELGLLPALVTVILEGKSQARSYATAAIKNIATAKENDIFMTSKELGLLPALVTVLREDNGQTRLNVCDALWKIGRIHENILQLADPQLGLLPPLVAVLRDKISPATTIACRVLMCLTNSPENQIHLAAPSIGLISAVLYVIRQDSGDARRIACDLLSLICYFSTFEAARLYVQSKVDLISMLSMIAEAGSDSSTWPLTPSMKRAGMKRSHITKVLSALMKLGRHSCVSQVLKSCGAYDIIKPLLVDNSPQGLKALFILVFLSGRDEGVGHQSAIVTAQPEAINLMIEVLSNTLDCKDGESYDMSTFGIAGGGGKDVESAALALETMLHLSFAYESDTTLQREYMTSDLGLEAILFSIANLPPDREYKVDESAVYCARRLLSRLVSIP